MVWLLIRKAVRACSIFYLFVRVYVSKWLSVTCKPSWSTGWFFKSFTKTSLISHLIYILIPVYISSLILSSSTPCRFALSGYLDKQWSQVVPLPPGTRLHYYRALGSAFPLLADFYRMVLAHALALSASQFVCMKLCKEKCTRRELNSRN